MNAGVPAPRLIGLRRRLLLAGVAVLVGTAIGVAALAFYRAQLQQSRQDIDDDLVTINALKANQLVAWRAERKGDAGVLADSPLLIDAIVRWRADPGSAAAAAPLLTHFRSLQHRYGYQDIVLVAPDGRIDLSLTGVGGAMMDEDGAGLAVALRARQPILTELHTSPVRPFPHLSVIAPLFQSAGADAIPLGAIQLRIDARASLYPLLAAWPSPGVSATSLLARRAGDAVQFLSPSEHAPGPVPSGREPLHRRELPAVRAALGETGVVEGRDFRGVPVVAALQAVPGSSWLLVTEADSTRFFAAGRQRALLNLALLLTVVCALVVIGAALWQRREKAQHRTAEQVLRTEIESRRVREREVERLSRLYDALGQVNQTLLRSTTREQVFASICKILIETSHFAMAWVGWVDPATQRVVPVASFGDDAGYLDQIEIYADDGPRGQGPTGTAIREERVYVCQDFSADPHTLPWREAAARAGWAGSVSLPIHFAGRACGALTLYARQPGVFGDAEVGLLEQAAANVSFALDALAGEQQRRRAELELKQAAERYTTMLNTTNDAFWLVDIATGRLLDVNEAALEMSGYSREELLGMHLTDLDVAHREVDVANRSEHILTQGSDLFETRHRTRDGRIIDVEVSTTPDADSRTFVAFLRDITERKRVEREILALNAELEQRVAGRTAELAATNEELRAIFDAASVGIVLMRERTILRCNRKLEEIFGYAPGEFDGAPTRLWYPDEASYVLGGTPVYTQMAEGGLHQREQQLVKKDGTRFWARLRGQVLDPQQPAKGALGVIEDITQERESYERLRQAKEAAEVATRAKSRFLANMSHEIRTPLNAILGMTHLLRQEDPDPNRQERLDKIATASRHLLQLINDILDLAKIEEQKLVLEQTELALDPVLRQVCALVGEKAYAKNLELVVDLDPALAQAAPLCGDPTRLTQVLLNFLGNAVKFTERGAIRLRVRIEEDRPDDQLFRFEIQDTGIGIAADQLGRLFDAFEQADSSTTRRYGGTGLGLAINRRLAELMGGEIGVTSQLGVGSTFWFTARLGKIAGAVRRPPRPIDVRGWRALVVDDQPEAREVLAAMLTAWGVAVTALDSGEGALEIMKAAAARYDLVLLDWCMPGLDGIETARRIAALPLAQQPIRLLLVTAYDGANLREDARGAGVASVLIKPVTPSHLYEVLSRVLGDLTVGAPPTDLIASDAAATLGVNWRGARVLLAEDDSINQEVGRGLLEAVGLEVDIANDGAEAFAMAQRTDYALILMDMQMPEVDGLAATRAIRAVPAGHRVPIVAMTANAFAEDRDRCLAAGMNDFVSKPVDPPALYATLLHWLSQTIRPPGPVPPPQPEVRAGALDLEAGRRNFGDAALYQRLLERFIESYPDSGQVIAGLLVHGEPAAAAALAHKLKGAASALALTEVARVAAAIEQAINAGQAPQPGLTGLQEALAAVIAARVPAPSAPQEKGTVPPAPIDPAVASRLLHDLLHDLLRALDRDNPDHAEPILAALGPLLPAAGVRRLRELVDAFDFRAAEAQVRLAAAALGIVLDQA